MKNLSSTLIASGRNIFLPALVIIGLSITSCKKEKCGGPAPKNVSANLDATEKSKKLRTSTAKALKDFVIVFNANQQAGSGGGSNNYSNVATNYTTYSTPSSNVYIWLDCCVCFLRGNEGPVCIGVRVCVIL